MRNARLEKSSSRNNGSSILWKENIVEEESIVPLLNMGGSSASGEEGAIVKIVDGIRAEDCMTSYLLFVCSNNRCTDLFGSGKLTSTHEWQRPLPNNVEYVDCRRAPAQL
jgi:hypothetical protein